MARYIDADKLAEQITTDYCGNCGIYNGEICCSCPMNDALNYIEEQPDAYVVAPRAEVARAEVAREIFDEIEKCMMHDILPTIGVYKGSLELRIAELKEKYTEEK